MFDGLIEIGGLLLVAIPMVVVFILYCIFGNRAATESYQEQEDMAYEQMMAEDEAALLQKLEVAEAAAAPEETVVEPKFAATFMPEQPKQQDLEATTVVPKQARAKSSAKQFDEEATMLLDKSELPLAAVANETKVAPHKAQEDGVLLPEKPLAFGYKMAWLAIPRVKSSEVLTALKLTDITPANWTKGLTCAYEEKKTLFVTPVLRDWVLVIGRGLWNKVDMSLPITENLWLRELRESFAELYYFSTMRVLENHGWAKLEHGIPTRAYAYSGELGEFMWCLGKPTQEELAVNPDMPSPDTLAQHPVYPDEQMVLSVASQWSIDTSFADYNYPADIGFVGTLRG